jgi:four helix bundle protein
VSIACNIVEGSARRTEREYLHFLNIATSSAAETRYLIDLSSRLRYLPPEEGEKLTAKYDTLCAKLKKLVSALDPRV